MHSALHHTVSVTLSFYTDFHTFTHEATNWKPLANISRECHVQVEAMCVKIQGRKSLIVATRMSGHSMVYHLKTSYKKWLRTQWPGSTVNTLLNIQGVTGGTDQTSGGCSLC